MTLTNRLCLVFSSLWVFAGACEVPSPEDRSELLNSPRILGLRGLPAEVRQGENFVIETLVVGDDGEALTDAQLSYSLCTQRRRSEERSGVSQICMQGGGLEEVSNPAVMLNDACSRFGPNRPPTQEGELGERPTDPDGSGGYYVPIRANAPASPALEAFGFQRIHCDLAGATRDIFDEYQERYKDNEHPGFAELYVNGEEIRFDEEGIGRLEVPAGSILALELGMRASAFEDYVLYSALQSVLLDREEEIRLWLYISGGTLSRRLLELRSSRRGGEVEFSLPREAGPIWLHLVATDDRGGSSWRSIEVLAL